jgi:hypothetical protein
MGRASKVRVRRRYLCQHRIDRVTDVVHASTRARSGQRLRHANHHGTAPDRLRSAEPARSLSKSPTEQELGKNRPVFGPDQRRSPSNGDGDAFCSGERFADRPLSPLGGGIDFP